MNPFRTIKEHSPTFPWTLLPWPREIPRVCHHCSVFPHFVATWGRVAAHIWPPHLLFLGSSRLFSPCSEPINSGPTPVACSFLSLPAQSGDLCACQIEKHCSWGPWTIAGHCGLWASVENVTSEKTVQTHWENQTHCVKMWSIHFTLLPPNGDFPLFLFSSWLLYNL